MKTLISLLIVFQLATINSTKSQVVVQGDSIYQGLKVYESTLSNVIERLGPPSHQKETMGTRNSKYTDGTCVTNPFVYGFALHYRKRHLTVYVNKRHNWVEEIHFDTASPYVSSKGIQARKSIFADVLASYGSINFDKKDNNFPKLQQESNGKQWFTKLMYPGISFVSFGERQLSENLSLRRVDEIWLE